MQRSSKILLITLIVLTTLTIIGVLLFTLELLYNSSSRTEPTIIDDEPPATAVASEIVILHSEPVLVSRFGLTATLTQHKKINNQVIDTTVSLSPAEVTTESLHFSAIGETIETDQYRFRIVNATDDSVQLLVLQLTAAE